MIVHAFELADAGDGFYLAITLSFAEISWIGSLLVAAFGLRWLWRGDRPADGGVAESQVAEPEVGLEKVPDDNVDLFVPEYIYIPRIGKRYHKTSTHSRNGRRYQRCTQCSLPYWKIRLCFCYLVFVLFLFSLSRQSVRLNRESWNSQNHHVVEQYSSSQ